MMHRRSFIKRLSALTGIFAAAVGLHTTHVYAQAKTIKVGVLHSLSGTMAISETVLKDVALMAFEEINAKGGVMGMKIEPVVVDPASNWPLFAEKARQLITQDKVAVIINPGEMSPANSIEIAIWVAVGGRGTLVPLHFQSEYLSPTMSGYGMQSATRNHQ